MLEQTYRLHTMGIREQIMKNDKLTNEQQAQNKSNLKKVGWLRLEINQMGY